MANPEQLTILLRGVQDWNEWRNQNCEEIIDLSNAHFTRLNLTGINLEKTKLISTFFYQAILRDANFINADLSQSNLSETDLCNATFYRANLNSIDLSGSNLSGVNFIDSNLIGANLSRANIHGATFIRSRLNHANFSRSDISEANFLEANLTSANLLHTIARKTNFEDACFNYACIDQWKIDHMTNFKRVTCTNIFLKLNNYRQPCERFPESRIFQEGEFTKFIQLGLNTIELVFDNGIDWKAFYISFQNLKQKFQAEEFSIKTFEKEPNGKFIIWVNVPLESNKIEMESEFHQKYQEALESLDSSYQQQFSIEYSDIEVYRQQGINFEEMIQRLANYPIPKNLNIAESQAEQ